MSAKRIKVCLRRWAWLLAVLIGAACAWKGGWLIMQNAVHGFHQLPQMAGALAGAGAMALAAEWLEKSERKGDKRNDVV